MPDQTPDPLWDGQGSDPELDRLEAALSLLRTDAAPPELPDRPKPLPRWLLPLAAAILLFVGAGLAPRFFDSNPSPDQAASVEDPSPAGAPGGHQEQGSDGRAQEPGAAHDTEGLALLRDGGPGRVQRGGLTGPAEPVEPVVAPAGSGGDFIYYEREMALSANPVHVRSMADVRLQELLHLPLFAPNYADQPRPVLARAWELDATGRRFTVELQRGFTWSDGEPVTADDVVFTVQALKDPGTRSLDRHQWEFVSRVEASDAHTVVFTLAGRMLEPPLERLYLKVLPRHAYDDTSIGYNDRRTNPVTGGPFRVAEKDHKNWILERAPSPWPAKLGSVRVQEVPELRTQVELLGYGYGHAMIAVAPSQRAEIDAADCCTLKPYPSKSWWYTAFNQKNEHLADARVRRAMSLAVDRQEALDLVGDGELISGPFTLSSRYYNHDVPVHERDLGAAAALMRAAGYRKVGADWTRDGQTIDLRFFYDASLDDDGQAVAANLVGQLRRFGINVSSPAALGAESWERRILQRTDYDLLLGVWSFDDTEDIGQLFGTGGARNFVNYTDDRTDQLLSGSFETRDPSEQQAYMKELHRRLAELQPYLFLWSPRHYSALSWDVAGAHIQAHYYFTQFPHWDLRSDPLTEDEKERLAAETAATIAELEEGRRGRDAARVDGDAAWVLRGGASVELVTRHDGNVHFPQPSPDGERIAYEVNYPAEKRTELYTADLGADGLGAPTLMIPDAMSSGRSSGGKRITHMLGWSTEGEADFAYTISDADGSQAIYVDGAQELIDDGTNKEPVWDPTMARFVFTSNRTGNGDLYLWDQGQQLQLTFDAVHAEIHPSWAPDGDKVAFVRAGKGESQVMVLDVNMFRSLQLVNFSGKDSTRPSFSPDGTKVAFLSNKGTDSVMRFGLWVTDARPGSTPRNIGPSVRIPTKGACSWTPDGKGVIAVIDDPDRGDPIAIFPIDGGAPRLLATGTTGNREPVLQVVDDRWRLFFTSEGFETAGEHTWQKLFAWDIPR